MSKSRPEFAIHLTDPVEIAEKKLMNALTVVEQQQKNSEDLEENH